MTSRLAYRRATVNEQGLASDKARIVGQKKRDGRGHFLRLAEPLRGHQLLISTEF
ncbi:hypothetical protein QFZ96_001439 [Paraburkholderia youngii]